MNNFATGWLASEEAARDAITLKRIYIKINDGNLFDGVMFSQIMFWHGRNKETGERRMKIQKQGHLWLAKKYSDWLEECGINEHTAKKCITRIKKRGLIVTKLWKFNNTPVLHMRIDWDEFERRIMSNRPERSNRGLDTMGLIDQTSEVYSITETTTETTTEIKSLSSPSDGQPPSPSPNGHSAANGNGKERERSAHDIIRKELEEEFQRITNRMPPTNGKALNTTWHMPLKEIYEWHQPRNGGPYVYSEEAMAATSSLIEAAFKTMKVPRPGNPGGLTVSSPQSILKTAQDIFADSTSSPIPADIDPMAEFARLNKGA